jgi:anti-sigma-K factor RskA
MTNEQDIAPTEIEALLPWYAAGALRHRDRQRVEAALRNDPALARQAELAREELAETISLNESLGVPTARAMDRLMAAIDDETLASRKARFAARYRRPVRDFHRRVLTAHARHCGIGCLSCHRFAGFSAGEHAGQARRRAERGSQ